MRLKHLFLGLAIAVGNWSLGGDAWARQWKPTPTQRAQQYLELDHSLSDLEHVLVFWFAPEFFENTIEYEPIRKMTQEYVIFGLIHFSIDESGVFKTESPEEANIELANSKLLSALPTESLPSELTLVTSSIKNTMAAGLGPVGGGMTFFVYDGTQFDRCAEGILWFNYLSERYEYETPLPGCR